VVDTEPEVVSVVKEALATIERRDKVAEFKIR
jgi:hypothetical protein